MFIVSSFKSRTDAARPRASVLSARCGVCVCVGVLGWVSDRVGIVSPKKTTKPPTKRVATCNICKRNSAPWHNNTINLLCASNFHIVRGAPFAVAGVFLFFSFWPNRYETVRIIMWDMDGWCRRWVAHWPMPQCGGYAWSVLLMRKRMGVSVTGVLVVVLLGDVRLHRDRTNT